MAHQDPITRFYANHPEALHRAHRAFLGGIADEAQAYIEENGLPHLAHHPEMENIRNMPKSEHLQEVKRLHAREQSGPSEDGTDEYRTQADTDLGTKAQRMRGHRRTPLERYR